MVVSTVHAFVPSRGGKRMTMKMSTSESPTTFSQNWRASFKNVINAGLTGSAAMAIVGVASADAGPTVTAPATASAPVVGSDGFITTDSGLKYRDTKVGTGEMPQPGDTVRVHYTGWLDDFESEKKFDSSYDRRSPLVFKVGVKQVIAGWDEGLLTNLKEGGTRDLIIPATLGYGSRGAGGLIPPNATLYFKIELVGIGNKANR
jgi:peptidylprolyl isomerase